MFKKYVKVTATFDCDGSLVPNYIFWDDNKRYPIDRIIDVRYATSLKAGGCGIRYTCRILGKERYIFLEENKWFVEVKENRGILCIKSKKREFYPPQTALIYTEVVCTDVFTVIHAVTAIR